MDFVGIATLLIVACFTFEVAVGTKYKTEAEVVHGKLNVHFVAHSHDDMGWLKTVAQYYTGAHNSIQEACVRDILNTVVHELLSNPDRRYNQVETGFFARWWREQNETRKEQVKEIIARGQLEFLNGGWCMHDEATTHYIDMIDQTTYGHRFLKTELGVVPKHGWQIDTFGHSSVQGYLLGTEVGFQSMFVARIDYRDKAQRKGTKSLEMIWRTSQTLGSSADIFLGVFPEHYNPPDTFELEVSNQDYTPVQDDWNLEGYNVAERVHSLVKAAHQQASLTRTNHILWPMGDDFTYQRAKTWFSNMDKLIHYCNLDGRVNVLYSTPSIYLAAKISANESWPIKRGDFFPYADSAFSYWTGYFTSRPNLKGYIRKLSAYLQTARQLEFMAGRSSVVNTDTLEEIMATVQHHDAVSGTERQAVAGDYVANLYKGEKMAEVVVNSALGCLSAGADSASGKHNITVEQCGSLNITYCPRSEAVEDGEDLVVLVYNSLGWERVEFVRILVNKTMLTVNDSEGTRIESQIIPVTHSERRVRAFHVEVELGMKPTGGPLYWLVFEVSIPPLGFRTYVVSPAKDGCAQLTSHESLQAQNDFLSMNNGRIVVQFSPTTGHLHQILHVKGQRNVTVRQEMLYYVGSSEGDCVDDDDYDDCQASGAYIFRPLDRVPRPVSTKTLKTTVIRGDVVQEVHQVLSTWLTQVIRLYKNQEHVEIQYTIGPTPTHDGLGKEVISRISTDLASRKTFFTDSNGRDFIRRVRDHRDDYEMNVQGANVAANYYPINLGLYASDGHTDFSVLVDRAVGGSSLRDGQVELMVHRNLLDDDNRGVDEPLNEKICHRASHTCQGVTVTGKYFIAAMPKQDAAQWRRSLGQRIYTPLLLAFTTQQGAVSSFSAFTPNFVLPPNVALLTLQELEDNTVLLRLAHLYQAEEHPEHSKMAVVELKNIFKDRQIVGAEEMNLSANQAKSEVKRVWWRTEDEEKEVPKRGQPFDKHTLTVELAPMEIRTFCSSSREA